MCESSEDPLLIQPPIVISTIKKRAISARFFHFYLVTVKE
ncbi:hypothetical protein FXE87_15370 [Vibrio mimicus]|nr:hypothetical protein FXE87_15370 [Vibrio mimicus]